ncbi:MAG: c-type cytochrome [Gemmatimonadota bacterium]
MPFPRTLWTAATRFARAPVIALFVGGLAIPGCEWFSTMSRTDAIQPHEMAPLPPPEHAVPLDGLPDFDLTSVEGMLSNPVPADDASRERGRAWYVTFCAVCHGEDGMGQGPISDKFPAIPPVAGAVRFSDAYLFALITNGRGLMPAYNRIPQTHRWDIVNYLRSMTFGSGTPASADTTPTGAAGADTTPASSTAADTGAAAP